MEQHLRLGRLAAGALGVVAVVAGIWLGLRSPEPIPMVVESLGGEPVASQPSGRRSGSLIVHVSGAVADPGLVVVGADDRVADVIAAAGGALGSADLAAINLAGALTDGQQVIVPSVGGGSGEPQAAHPDDGLVHLNSASAVDLQRLPGVGEVLAQRIIAHRDANGPFTAVEDLLDVSGIGERKLEGLRDMASVP